MCVCVFCSFCLSPVFILFSSFVRFCCVVIFFTVEPRTETGLADSTLTAEPSSLGNLLREPWQQDREGSCVGMLQSLSSLCLSLSISLSLSVSVYLCIPLCLSLSVHYSLSLFISVCLSLFLSLTVSLS